MIRLFTKLFLWLIVSLVLISKAPAEEMKSFRIEWGAPETIMLHSGNKLNVFVGEHFTHLAGTASLPWFIAPIVNDSITADNAKLVNIQWDTLSPLVANVLADADLIGNDFFIQPNEEVFSSSGRDVLVFPLRMSEGRIERLISFALEYETTPDPAIRTDYSIPDYTEQSVLHTGDWYKLGIQESGVYKITYADLQQMGIQPSVINPHKIRLYGNGNGMLPEANNQSRPDDLIENAVYVHGQEDGSFDEGDYILFYGLSPVRIRHNSLTNRFDHQVNFYTDTTFYFLNVDSEDDGLRITNKEQASGNISKEINSYLAYHFHELDLVNLMSTGREWYGEEFSTTRSNLDLEVHFPNILTDRQVFVQAHFVARSVNEDMFFNMEVNGEEVINLTQLRSVNPNESLYARESVQIANYYPDGPRQNIRVNFYANSNGSRGWLNYIRLNAWCGLQYNGGQFLFRNPSATGSGAISRFHVEQAGHEVSLWDITNPLRPLKQDFDINGQELVFKVLTDSLREYILFDDSHFLQVVSARPIENQNLHGISDADYIIVAHQRFREQAMDLAEFHRNRQGLNTIVVCIDEIYNEFASGAADITALRDFVRMVYLRSNQNLKYLLMFGDASYDYKDRLSHNTNFVPTYQATESLRETASWVTDDYFGLLDIEEGYLMAGTLDVGIGRFPVTNEDEAMLMVQKVKHYMTPGPEVTGGWRNNITFMGDDRDNNLHFNQAESLAYIVDTSRNILNISKVYLDAFPRQTVAGGFRYPDANKAIVKQIETGALLVNYTGHGGVNGLTDERVITVSDINGLRNFDQMPLFITATCEFSRFDDPEFVSAGERLILNRFGGGIALMTTTRLAFAHSNFVLNRRIYFDLFKSTMPGVDRLGDVLRRSKNPSNANIYNFVLLGDPALRLVTPSKRVVTTTFNNEIITRVDTIRAMSLVHITGEIVDEQGKRENNFNGYVYPKVFDKKTIYRTLGNATGSHPTNFSYFDKVIHYGKVSVRDGSFEFSFAVPKDIAYQYDVGRISYYAVDTSTYADASGEFSDLIIGGIDQDMIPDQHGPDIDMYINYPGFKDGDVVKNDVVVHAYISDPQGINHLGVGIGRDIMGYLNHSTATTFNLNEAYVSDTDSYTSGRLTFTLPYLENGTHTFKLKVWDLHNNSSEAEVHFVIDGSHNISLNRLSNRPNPFNENTQFVFEHDKTGELVDIQIDLFRIDGTHATTLEAKEVKLSSVEFVLDWNGRDANGYLLPAGLYIYRFILTDQQGYQISVNRKLVISR